MLPFLTRSTLIATVLAGLVTPVCAQATSSGALELRPGFDRATATQLGLTHHEVSLAELTGRLSGGDIPAVCLDDRPLHSSREPGHVVNLPNGLASLRLSINNNGKPTVIVVQAPDGNILCGTEGQSFNEDAAIAHVDWQAGEYKVWVAAESAGQQYRLSARER